MFLEQDKQKKATEILGKLLHAALKAQQEGKYFALQKLIFEANRVSAHLTKVSEDDRYTPVQGVIVE